jgi:hypothetical protein
MTNHGEEYSPSGIHRTVISTGLCDSRSIEIEDAICFRYAQNLIGEATVNDEPTT